MQTKEKIIIVGYPKSGNTWVTRLTAQLLNCPVKGFLYEKHNEEIAIEGLNRNSQYECFKSHHQYFELSQEDIANAKIIYVIRDPRDISLSGVNYFYNFRLFDPWKFRNTKIRYFLTIINAIFRRGIGLYLMRKRMIKAVLKGNKKAHHWCRVSWKKHLYPYLQEDAILKVKYENILDNPIFESKRILDFVGESRSLIEIEEAVELQSFNTIKKKFLEKGQTHKATFLREGSSNRWKEKLNKLEKRLFLKHLEAEIVHLDYQKE